MYSTVHNLNYKLNHRVEPPSIFLQMYKCIGYSETY